jgi:hypothetical protein
MLRIGGGILSVVLVLLLQQVATLAAATAENAADEALAEARNRAAAVDVAELVKRVQETGQTMRLPENVATAEGSKAARQVLERFQAPVFQEVLQEQERSIMEKMNIEIPMATSGKPEEESSAESFHLFFSSAMPEETVHAYLEDIARAGSDSITPVLHGFPFGLTDKAGNGRYFNRVLRQDPACRDTPDLCCQRWRWPSASIRPCSGNTASPRCRPWSMSAVRTPGRPGAMPASPFCCRGSAGR